MKRTILGWCLANTCVGTLAVLGHQSPAANAAAITPPESSTTSTTSTTTSTTVVVTVPSTTEAPTSTTVQVTVEVPTTESSPPPSLGESYNQAIPSPWRNAIPLYVKIIPGPTSWTDPRHGILVSEKQASRSYEELLFTIGHEFGHQIAYLYGDVWNYGGAPPVGWPGQHDPEAWADCVGQAFTGHRFSDRCSSASLAFTQDWLASGPSSHEVTYPGFVPGEPSP